METRREETGPVTDSMLEKRHAFQTENAALQAELLELKAENSALKRRIAELEVAAGKKQPEPPPE